MSPLNTPRFVLNDSDDDHVIAAAVAANANLFVSGDAKHYLPLEVHNSIQIVNVRTLMTIIKETI